MTDRSYWVLFEIIKLIENTFWVYANTYQIVKLFSIIGNSDISELIDITSKHSATASEYMVEKYIKQYPVVFPWELLIMN